MNSTCHRNSYKSPNIILLIHSEIDSSNDTEAAVKALGISKGLRSSFISKVTLETLEHNHQLFETEASLIVSHIFIILLHSRIFRVEYIDLQLGRYRCIHMDIR